MRKQRSLCTLSSYDNWSSMANVNYENSYENSIWPEFMSFDPDQMSNSYQDVFLSDYSAAGDPSLQNLFAEYADDSQTVTDETYLAFENPWNPLAAYTFPEQFVDESTFILPPMEDCIQSYFVEPDQLPLLQYGSPTITDYGAVALLLRHLIRVDITHYGAVSVYNFPAMSVMTLNSAGDKCYIKHPNGLIYLEGSMVHIMTGNDRMVKVSNRGIAFSTYNNSLAYFVDESGTKTTTGKFIDLSQDLTMDVFYDGCWPNHGSVEEECYKMASEATYENLPDGSEVWNVGRVRIKQDKWGEVTISQNNNDIVISTSPTVRRVSVEKPLVSMTIDCFQRNYLTVKKGSCLVTSAYCGLVVQNRSQKAGLDRNGKLVLF